MVRRVTPSQYRNMVRQAEQKRRQAIEKYNREARFHNQKVQAAERKQKQAIEKYKRDVRAHNARVRQNQNRLKAELERLRRRPVPVELQNFRVSVNTVQTAYERLESAAEAGRLDDRYNDILDLSEREAANNAHLMNALLEDEASSDGLTDAAADSPITPNLRGVSSDLADRWQGALFALNPKNPDAARHFCTSAREIIAGILDARAPNDRVEQNLPNCERTQQGAPTRRAKIRYMLHVQGMGQEDLESFIETDMNNVVQLFHTFNEGTHGEAGRFTHAQLHAIRQRVEDGIGFLLRLI